MNRYLAELRSDLTGDSLSGHAAVFGTLASLPQHYEAIGRDAFDDVLDNDVRALINHDPSLLLARTGSGTMKISTDDSGLYFEIPKLPNTTYANDLRELVGRGDLNSMSFAFMPGEDTYTRAKDGRQIRTHTKIKQLLDVSPVTYPAYDGTDVMLRHMTFDRNNPMKLIRAKARLLIGASK